MKGNKLVNWEKAIQCLICLQEPRHLLLKQSCSQRGRGVISKLTLCTLWQQKQQTARCAARILPWANSGVLPLPSHAHLWCTPISYMFERPWVQAADVLVPLLMSFLLQSPSFSIPLHHLRELGREKYGWAKWLHPACVVLEQLSFSWALRISPYILLPAV